MKKLVYIVLSLAAFQVSAQSVSINNDGSNAHPSAILEMKSASQGILLPRITEVQRASITAPAQGLLVFQTDGTAGFYYHNGSAWISIGSGANGDNLGDHTANQTLNMATNPIIGVGNLTVSGATHLAGNSYPTSTALNEQILTSNGEGILSAKDQAGQVVVHATNLLPITYSAGSRLSATSGRPFYDNVIVAPPPSVGTYKAYNPSVPNSSVGHQLFAAKSYTDTACSGFIAAAAGYYQITASSIFSTTGTTLIHVNPFINITSYLGKHKATYYGSSNGSTGYDARHRGRGIVSAIVKLEIGDVVGIFGNNATDIFTSLTIDETSTLTIIKL